MGIIFVIYAVGLIPSAIIAHHLAKSKNLNHVNWVWIALFFSVYSLPFLILKKPNITSIILSGGRATRMSGIDKGLVTLQKKPLIQHVINRLMPQVDEVLINANREIFQYQTFGYPVLQDIHADFIGPLAGFSLGLQHAKHDYLLTVPCDSPFLPLDLAQRLLTALIENNADIAVASSDGHAHPVFSLCRKSVLPSLNQYLALGERRVSAWQKSLNYIEVDFSDTSDAFINLNTAEDLAALECRLMQSSKLKSDHA